MSWTNELYQLYDQFAGKEDSVSNAYLLPIAHSTQNAQIEISIDGEGNFQSARKIPKEDASTVIPVTEDSATRSSGITPHPFADKLVYLAGDYAMYADGGKKDFTKYFDAYLRQLSAWEASSNTHPSVTALKKYVEKRHVLHDLIAAHIMESDENGALNPKAKIEQISQLDCFVRFRIVSPEVQEERTWKDATLQECFISYYASCLQNRELCYALGEILPITTKHPSRIRNAGDKGKLISANDESGFSYLGRFEKKEEALSISYEFSQKMHNALKWLIARQGIYCDSMVLVAWENHLEKLPRLIADANSMWEDEIPDIDEDEVETASLPEDTIIAAYRKKLQTSLFGNKLEIQPDSRTMIMVLDAATTGRDSISMYEEMVTSDFFENLEKWHMETSWIRLKRQKQKNKINSFSLYEIAQGAYGTESGGIDKKLQKSVYLRLIPCVISHRNLPMDIVRALFNRACNPLAYEKTYNWYAVLETACGMIRKKEIEQKGACSMGLDYTCTHRDYLYGRLLAIADVAESETYDKTEARTTNARRYFNAFANRPYSTWRTIELKLDPYLSKLSLGRRKRYEILMQEVYDMFDREDFMDNSKLQPIFLHAYHCQVRELYKKKQMDTVESEEEV